MKTRSGGAEHPAKGRDPWEMEHKWAKSYHSPRLLPGDHFQAAEQWGDPGSTQWWAQTRSWESREARAAQVCWAGKERRQLHSERGLLERSRVCGNNPKRNQSRRKNHLKGLGGNKICFNVFLKVVTFFQNVKVLEILTSRCFKTHNITLCFNILFIPVRIYIIFLSWLQQQPNDQ